MQNTKLTKAQLGQYYQAVLRQSAKLPESSIQKFAKKISEAIHNEGEFMQFAMDESTQEKSVFASQGIKAYEEAFMIRHVASFGVNETREKIRTNKKMRELFRTLVSDADRSGVDTLKNQVPLFGNLKEVVELRKALDTGMISIIKIF